MYAIITTLANIFFIKKIKIKKPKKKLHIHRKKKKSEKSHLILLLPLSLLFLTPFLILSISPHLTSPSPPLPSSHPAILSPSGVGVSGRGQHVRPPGHSEGAPVPPVARGPPPGRQTGAHGRLQPLQARGYPPHPSRPGRKVAAGATPPTPLLCLHKKRGKKWGFGCLSRTQVFIFSGVLGGFSLGF